MKLSTNVESFLVKPTPLGCWTHILATRFGEGNEALRGAVRKVVQATIAVLLIEELRPKMLHRLQNSCRLPFN